MITRFEVRNVLVVGTQNLGQFPTEMINRKYKNGSCVESELISVHQKIIAIKSIFYIVDA